MIDIILFFGGFLPLTLGANMLVDGGSALARRFNIPMIVIGLTVVAFGTSLPELIVNVFSSLEGNSDIALGNVVGSNIFNILFILGLSALFRPLTVKTNTTWIEIPLCILSSMVLLIAANDILADGALQSVISRTEGLLFLSFFVVFLAYTVSISRTGIFPEEIIIKGMPVWLSLVFIFSGLVLLVVGGKLIVSSAVQLAQAAGISQRIIALTIISAGTSLPELATSVVAARKGNVDIAIGNIVGSNIFNVFFILGLSAVIQPVIIPAAANVDLLLNLLAGTLLFLFIFTGSGRKIERREGVIFLACYMAYLTALIKFL